MSVSPVGRHDTRSTRKRAAAGSGAVRQPCGDQTYTLAEPEQKASSWRVGCHAAARMGPCCTTSERRPRSGSHTHNARGIESLRVARNLPPGLHCSSPTPSFGLGFS